MLESQSLETTQPSVFQPRYHTIAPIGRGGMAEVLLAVMTSAGGVSKLAVLKQIWPEFAGDPHFVAMFLEEARLSVRMSHPNLVQTYEVIDDGTRLAIAMEYLDGQPLARVLNRLHGAHVLDLPLRLRIVARVLAALDYAHELNDYDGTPLAVVHRDVSPHNVFITYEGGVKLVDFGVAKNLASAHQTRPGTLKGKFSYMAPEQFLGRPSDRRADIFSVGVMLWEMLAGRRFWNGASDNEIASHLVSDRPLPALPADLGLPAGVEAICTRALERDCNRRFATAAEMEVEIEQVLTGANYAFERPLARAVTSAFGPERAQRQLLVDHHLRQVRSGSYSAVTMRTGERAMPVVTMSTGERVTPVVTRSGMSRTVVMPPPPPPSRARARAQARVTSLRRTLWSVVLGVAAATPLALLVILIVGGSRAPAPVTAAAPARTEPARPAQALTNEPIEVARFIQRVVPLDPVVITPAVVELPPPPARAQPAAPAAVRSHRRAVAAPVPGEEVAKPTSPPPFSSSQRSRSSFTDSTSVPLRPRPIDVVNPFVVPRTAAITGAPGR
jgi:serine/threonine-protein kinase